LYIPQSKIKDFCQPPLGKGAFGAAFKLLDKSEFDQSKADRIHWKLSAIFYT